MTEAANVPHITFDRHDSYAALSAGEKSGVVVRRLRGGAGEVVLSPTDPPGLRDAGRCRRGALVSPAYETAVRFDTLVPSWSAMTPEGTWLRLEVRARSSGAWTPWFDMGVWASGGGAVARHSVERQEAGGWRVLTDVLRGDDPADAYRYRLTLYTAERGVSPKVHGLSFVCSDSRRHGASADGSQAGVSPRHSAWGKELPVPARSQMVYPAGEAWCSPASLSMVMAYWAVGTGDGGLDRPVPEVADGVYDHVYGWWGNWPFNTAYAAASGLVGIVGRVGSIEEAERWVEAGIPLVVSVAWDNRDVGSRLSGAPLERSEGHLLVIRGFDRSGGVIVNDPAGRDDADVRRVYERDELSRAWLETGSGGVAYLVYPPDRDAPYTGGEG